MTSTEYCVEGYCVCAKLGRIGDLSTKKLVDYIVVDPLSVYRLNWCCRLVVCQIKSNKIKLNQIFIFPIHHYIADSVLDTVLRIRIRICTDPHQSEKVEKGHFGASELRRVQIWEKLLLGSGSASNWKVGSGSGSASAWEWKVGSGSGSGSRFASKWKEKQDQDPRQSNAIRTTSWKCIFRKAISTYTHNVKYSIFYSSPLAFNHSRYDLCDQREVQKGAMNGGRDSQIQGGRPCISIRGTQSQ